MATFTCSAVMAANGKTVTITCGTTGTFVNLTGGSAAVNIPNSTACTVRPNIGGGRSLELQFDATTDVIASATTITVDLDYAVHGLVEKGELLKVRLAAGVITDSAGNTNSLQSSMTCTNGSTQKFNGYYNESAGVILGGRMPGAKAAGYSDATLYVYGEAELNMLDGIGHVTEFTNGTLRIAGNWWGNPIQLSSVTGFSVIGDTTGTLLYNATNASALRKFAGTTVSLAIYGVIRGDQPVPAASWAQVGATSTYTTSVPTNEPVCVIENFDNTAATPKGFLVKAAGLSGGSLATAGTWYWASDVLYVRGSSSQAMTGQADGYWRYGVDGIYDGSDSRAGLQFLSCTNCTAGPNLGLAVWTGDTATTSDEHQYGVGFVGGSGHYARGVHTTCTGNHGIAFVGACHDFNLGIDCIADCLRSGPGGGTQFVAYSQNGPFSGGFTNCVAIKRPLLRVDGLPLDRTTRNSRVRATNGVGGFFTHGGGADAVDGFKAIGCVCVNVNVDLNSDGYDCYGTSFGNGAFCKAPTNSLDASTFGCAYIDCQSTNQVGIENDFASSYAMQRCWTTLYSPSDLKLTLNLTGVTYNHTTKTLTKTGGFTTYSGNEAFAANDFVTITGGTGVTAGNYTIASRDSNDQITLSGSGLGIGGDPTDVAISVIRYAGITASYFPTLTEATRTVLFDACAIASDTSPAFRDQCGALRVGYLGSGASTNVYAINNTFVQLGAAANKFNGVVWISDPTKCNWHGYGNVWANYASGGGCLATENNANSFTTSNWIEVGSWYYGIQASNAWLVNTSTLNDLAEYTAGIDPTGVYGVDPGFTSVTNGSVDLEGTAGSAIRTTRKAAQVHTARGINGKAYGRNYGPYQYGGGGIRSRPLGARLIRSRVDG